MFFSRATRRTPCYSPCTLAPTIHARTRRPPSSRHTPVPRLGAAALTASRPASPVLLTLRANLATARSRPSSGRNATASKRGNRQLCLRRLRSAARARLGRRSACQLGCSGIGAASYDGPAARGPSLSACGARQQLRSTWQTSSFTRDRKMQEKG